MVEDDFGNYEAGSFCRIPLPGGKNFPLLNDVIGQKFSSYFVQVFSRQPLAFKTVTL